MHFAFFFLSATCAFAHPGNRNQDSNGGTELRPTLYQTTNSLVNETLSDISVVPDGTAHVVWNAQEADFNVYGFIFQAPSADAPLTITKLVAGATDERVAGLAATFTDADPNGKVSDYSATINWGDGTTSTGWVVKNPQGGFAVLAAHQYALSGTYMLTLTISDSGGSSVTATQKLVVPPDRN